MQSLGGGANRRGAPSAPPVARLGWGVLRADGGAPLRDRIGKGSSCALLLASGIAGWRWQMYDAAKTLQAGALFSLLALVLLLRRGGRHP